MDPNYLAEHPRELDHPEKIELWIGPYRTPAPTGHADDLDDRFRYAGMIWRKALNAHAAELEVLRNMPLNIVRSEVPQSIRMTLSWELLPSWLDDVLPTMWRTAAAVPLVALVLQSPAEGMRGYAGRVERHGFDLGRHHGGALTVEATYDDSGVAMHWWYRTPVEVTP